jgi:hypothetical protein
MAVPRCRLLRTVFELAAPRTPLLLLPHVDQCTVLHMVLLQGPTASTP